MSKKMKSNQAVDSATENTYLDHESDTTTEGIDKRKKPLLERLGLIEPIIKQDEDGIEHSDPYEVEISTTLDPKSQSNSDFEYQEKDERYNCEKLSINEIYVKSQLESNETNTIYLIENFIKALPANLPADIKRQSIINIISASQIDIICLLKDGNQRLDTLRNYYQGFSANVDEIISSNEKQIRKLNERIAYHNRIIEEKKNTKEEQKAIIEFEMQKLSNIIEFIENKVK